MGLRIGDSTSSIVVDAKLANYGNRIEKLLKTPAIEGNPNLVASLDDSLGAVYALILANHYKVKERATRSIQTAGVAKLAARIGNGDARTDEKWLAGFHLNSAIFRIAAVYHRVLKIVAASKKKNSDIADLIKMLGAAGYTWTYTHLDVVRKEVNLLKHTSKGLHSGRVVTYQDAVSAIGELLNLIEDWKAKAGI